MAFDLYIKDEIEKLVEKSSGKRVGSFMYEVAAIKFATSNNKLIELLK